MSDQQGQAPQMPNIDINQIMQSAQQIAQNIGPDERAKIENMDMDQMFNHVTDTVFNSMEQSGRAIDPATKSQMKVMSKAMLGQVMEGMEANAPAESKIDLGDLAANAEGSSGQKLPQKDSTFEEVGDDEDVPELRPRCEDSFFPLQVSLEDLYVGKTKKLAVQRTRLDKSGKKAKKEKRKIEVPVVRGARDGQEIRFNREGNEKPGYESGDIVITLSQKNHDYFERHSGSDLLTVKNISLYESYAAGRGDIRIVLRHLDGTYLVLKADDGVPLHARDGTRKVRGFGMPVQGKNEYGDLYIRFNLILPESFEGEHADRALAVIGQLFPVLPTNRDEIVYENDDSKKSFDVSAVKTREVELEEISEEDLEQLDYESEDSYESDGSEYSEYTDE